MPRKPSILSNEHFYHITARSNNKEHFYVEPKVIWAMLLQQLRRLQLEHKIEIVALVLMHNHFHMIVLTPEKTISEIMQLLMLNLTLNIQRKSGRINKVFGGRYKGSIILDDQHLFNAYKYIYRNPVAANLCQKVEDYPYSTYHYKSHGKPLPITISTLSDFNNEENFWLNGDFSKDEALSIKAGLIKTVFAYKVDKHSGKEIKPADLPFKK